MKIHYFIEEKRDQKRHQNLIKVEEKVKKHRSHKTKEKLICTPQISTKTRHFQLQKLSNNRAVKCQQQPAQPRAAEFHSLSRIK